MSLSLFPARIRWSNADGTLTPEAYRALQALLDRVGGPIGDQGVDSFANTFASAAAAPQTGFEMTMQAPTQDAIVVTGTKVEDYIIQAFGIV